MRLACVKQPLNPLSLAVKASHDAIVRLSIKILKSCATANAIVTFLVVANELIKNIIVCNEVKSYSHLF